MHDDFGVAVGLEDGAAMLELAAPLGGVGEVAIVAECDLTLVAVDHDRLSIKQSFVAGSGVARVTDGQTARELRKHTRLENLFDFAHRAVNVQLLAVTGNDARRFLAAMLQRVKTEIGEVRGFGVTEDAEDTTLVVKMIVGKCEFLAHFAVSVRSNELAQASRSDSMGLSITARPLCWMRNEPSRMTLPSSRAATWYCLAISRTRASFDGEAETTARTTRSLKRTDSAGERSSNWTEAPKENEPV